MLIPSGPSDAKLLVVVDCVSGRDLYSKTILADREFDKMLMEAGGNRASVFTTALIRGQVYGQTFDTQISPSRKDPGGDYDLLFDRYVRPSVTVGLEGLVRDIELVRPRVVLALGNGALFALTGKWGIGKWRSSILEWESPGGHKCLVVPTFPLDYLYKVWEDRPTIVHDIRKAWQLAHAPTAPEPPNYNFLIEPSFSSAASTLNQLIAKATGGPLKLSVDIETRGGHCACIGIAWSKLDAICIPQLRAVNPLVWEEQKHRCHYWREEEEVFLTHLLYRLLTHPNVEVIGQNFLYDAQYFYRWLLFIPRVKRDTMLTQHTMFSSMPKGLDFLSSLYCSYHVYWKDESKDWHPKLGERQLWIYNCKDACVTYEVDEEQQALVNRLSNHWPQLREIHDFQQELFYPVLDTMNRGLKVNNESKERLSAELEQAINERNEWLREVLEMDLNIKSPKQMKDLFYRVLAQKEVINRSTHKATTDDAALEKIASREPLLAPVCAKIRELRSLGVFRSTFLEAPVDVDQRMRCSFNIGGTKTFRFSSSENAFGSGMNLQNVPTGDEEENLPNIRALFLPDPGFEFFDIDLSSADLRVVVWESDCTLMKQWFAEGKVPYVEIAKEYFQDPTIDKQHDAYKAFKVICHGTNYLGGGPEIASRMPKSAKVGGLDADKITAIQDWYFGKFPEIKEWHRRTCSNLRRDKFIQNVFGYRVWFLGRIDNKTEKEAIAAIPQSTVACLINRGYKQIHDNEPEIEVLLQVHDSLAGQYPLETRVQSRQKIIDHCTIPLQYPSGMLTIPVGIKTSEISWGDCK